MTDHASVPLGIFTRLRAVCLELPEAYEEPAWVGTRWMVRKKNFAHVLVIEAGWPPAYARAAGTDGPATVLTFRSSARLDAPRFSRAPFFKPVWWPNIAGIVIDDRTDGTRPRISPPAATACWRRRNWLCCSSGQPISYRHRGWGNRLPPIIFHFMGQHHRGKQVIRSIFVVCGAIVLTGCVSTKNVKADMGGLQGGEYRTVVVTSREKPSFGAMTAGKAGFGLIGAAAMISAGNKIVRENNVDDPAVYIGNQLAAALSEKLGVQVSDNGGKLTDTSKPDQLATQYAGSDLLLDVQTVNWSFTYFPADWNNYRVIYSAKLRLIDTRNKKLLAEGFCARVPEKTADAPSHALLLADNAARLKSELRIAADQCIPELASKVLGIDGLKAAAL